MWHTTAWLVPTSLGRVYLCECGRFRWDCLRVRQYLRINKLTSINNRSVMLISSALLVNFANHKWLCVKGKVVLIIDGFHYEITGSGCASVLNTHSSNCIKSSLENIKYKYFSVSAKKKLCCTSSWLTLEAYTSLMPEKPASTRQCLSIACNGREKKEQNH